MYQRDVEKTCNISICFNDRTTKEQGKPCTIAPKSRASDEVKEISRQRLMIINSERVREFSSEGVEQIPPYGNFGVKVCRGVAIKRGHL